MAVRAKRIGFNELRARLDIRLVKAEHGLGVRGIQLVDRSLLPHRVVEQRAHGAIADEDSLLQPLVKVFNSHRVLCPGSPIQ